MCKIFAADQTPGYLEGIKISIRQIASDFNFKTAADINSLISVIIESECDLLILDCSVLTSGPAEFLGQLITQKNIKTILLFDGFESNLPEATRHIRYHGLLNKAVDIPEFNRAVSSVLDGRFYFSPSPSSCRKPKVRPLSEYEISLLTSKESKVLEYLTNGDLNKQIASKLNIKEDSVKAIVSSILKKLRIHNRTTLAIANHRFSLVSGHRSREQCEDFSSHGRQPL